MLAMLALGALSVTATVMGPQVVRLSGGYEETAESSLSTPWAGGLAGQHKPGPTQWRVFSAVGEA